MNDVKWNLLKNDRLKRARGALFEDILKSELIKIKSHPSRENQKIMLVKFKGYIWVIPYVIDKEGNLFLKTLFPSRRYTKMYKEGKL
jgi:hypothetical protein